LAFARSEVSSVSDIDSAEISAGSHSNLPDEFPPELADAPAVRGDQRKPAREGLPPGYRMRADAHYVDQLLTRRERAPDAGDRQGDLQDDRDPRERRSER